MNIGSMLNVMPLTGDPLVFVSQGGTSMVMALLAVGIILSVSKTLPTKT
jgi:cell division protein FtsW (lipid II flippase)